MGMVRAHKHVNNPYLHALCLVCEVPSCSTQTLVCCLSLYTYLTDSRVSIMASFSQAQPKMASENPFICNEMLFPTERFYDIKFLYLLQNASEIIRFCPWSFYFPHSHSVHFASLTSKSGVAGLHSLQQLQLNWPCASVQICYESDNIMLYNCLLLNCYLAASGRSSK